MSRGRNKLRRICFVTGTRAEFGLMESVLRAITVHRNLELQIVATGMHLDPACGHSLDQIRAAGWRIDVIVPWKPAGNNRVELASQTGLAISRLATVLEGLDPDVVLVVGDRVEAFAAASAGHLCGRVVAHVHGGDRALGQVDDALRHAITKLSHLHFPATAQSAHRIRRLGEESWRIHLSGSPGIDGMRDDARSFEQHAPATGALSPKKFALLALHPTESDEAAECRRARLLLRACRGAGLPQTIIVCPNNDPGAAGILAAWEEARSRDDVRVHKDLPRGAFLGLLRDAAMLVGNSSSGIIEAASFGTPVLDVGERQLGRQRGCNVYHEPWDKQRIAAAINALWRGGRPRRYPARNIYGTGRAGQTIAPVLATVRLDAAMRHKLIPW